MTWSTPECPFSIECSIRVLDDIRLSVTDAFFSLPRGGAEIGGILLGDWQGDRLTISHYAALDCEHALGPSFTLSVSDENRLQDLIRAASSAGGLPVGWYHSHTRSGVLLSESDLTIHNRYFPEPWQVALVVRPHAFEPMRAGFFFRGPGGIIHSSASYHEFLIEPQPLQQVPRSVPVEAPPPPSYRPEAAGHIVDVRAEPPDRPVPAPPIVEVRAERPAHPAPAAPVASSEPVPSAPVAQTSPVVNRRAAEPAVPPPPAPKPAPRAAASEPAKQSESAPLPIPGTFETQPQRSWTWLKVLLVVAVGAAAGAALYAERDAWYPAIASWGPAVTSLWHRAPVEVKAASIGLNTLDQAGQLQIRWDANSALMRRASGGSLEIVDGDSPAAAIALDAPHLASGVFTYGRRNERVDVALVLDQPGAAQVRQITSFLGQKPPVPAAPAPAAPPAAAPPKQDREEMRQLVAGLRAQLDAELEHSRKLEKLLAAARTQLREQQIRRLGNQARPPEQ